MNECAQRNAPLTTVQVTYTLIIIKIIIANFSSSSIMSFVVMSSAAKHSLRRQGPPPQAVICQIIQLFIPRALFFAVAFYFLDFWQQSVLWRRCR